MAAFERVCDSKATAIAPTARNRAFTPWRGWRPWGVSGGCWRFPFQQHHAPPRAAIAMLKMLLL